MDGMEYALTQPPTIPTPKTTTSISATFIFHFFLLTLPFSGRPYGSHAEKMASALSSSTVFSKKVSSLRTAAGNLSHFTCKIPLRYNPLPLTHHFPRWRPVRATLMEDKEVKMVVEESFKSSTVLDKGGLPSSNGHSSTDSMLNWTVKLEQSINIFLTDSVIKILDTLYHDRDYARFFVLETIARVPYFAFMSVLHMYESFGWWRRADYIKVHFAESWNEMHHLLIMEELGGNAWWFDRFLAQHIAVFYYFMTAAMYIISPRMAYHFSECVEGHAFSTYDKFIKTQGEELKELPAPEIAVKYYTGDDLYLFDEFQTSRPAQSRRPKIENLYDVFVNIRDDEAEHCKTMKACQTHGNLRSPHSDEGRGLEDDGDSESEECLLVADDTITDCEGIVDCIKKSVTYSSHKPH